MDRRVRLPLIEPTPGSILSASYGGRLTGTRRGSNLRLMETVFSQIGPWLFLLSLGSGMGVPLGIPPGPDDPVISRVAPEDCAFYTTWAASATANARSKNQAEQML